MTTGKVFAESANIYEDQAKVLFDYYKKAAEKIVNEEIDYENKIAALQNLIAKTEKKKKISLYLCWTIVGLIFFFIFGNKLKKYAAQLEELNTGKTAIRKNYKVNKIGVAYVPVATQVPFEGKSFVVSHSGGTDNTDFSLSVIHQPKELKQSLSRLEEGLDSVPLVESNEDAEQINTSNYSTSVQKVTMHDYMGNIDRQVRNISYLLHDSDTRSVALPVIDPNSEADVFLDEFATTEPGDKPVVKVFSTDGFDDKLKSFSNLNDLKKDLETDDGDGGNTEYFKRLIRKLGDSVQIVSRLKTSSTSSLVDYTTGILSAVLKAGYNQYSPQLEAEELTRIRETRFNYEECVESYKPFELKESSKVKYEIFSRTWVAEDNTRTNMPFGINQIEEEVLMPLINNLMMETRVERLKIYNNIKDQKLSYLNKWHQDVEAAFRDNRKAGQDLITQITNAYAEYSTAHNTYVSYKNTQSSMKRGSAAEAEEITQGDAAIEELESKVESCRETGDAFQAYMNTLQTDINESSERFGFVQYYEASLRDSESQKVANSIHPELLQNLDPRRRKLVGISSYAAAYANLPPLPQVEEELMRDFATDLSSVADNELNRIEYAVNEVADVQASLNGETEEEVTEPSVTETTDTTEVSENQVPAEETAIEETPVQSEVTAEETEVEAEPAQPEVEVSAPVEETVSEENEALSTEENTDDDTSVNEDLSDEEDSDEDDSDEDDSEEDDDDDDGSDNDDDSGDNDSSDDGAAEEPKSDSVKEEFSNQINKMKGLLGTIMGNKE